MSMLSNIIIRSAAAFGGAPFRLTKCTALGSAGAGAAGGAAIGGVPGALVGGALGLASSLVGGLFGKSNTNKTNQMNYKIMQEQNRFNAEEAKKNRDWQELMYRMFGTSTAKANDMRAAGRSFVQSGAESLLFRCIRSPGYVAHSGGLTQCIGLCGTSPPQPQRKSLSRQASVRLCPVLYGDEHPCGMLRSAALCGGGVGHLALDGVSDAAPGRSRTDTSFLHRRGAGRGGGHHYRLSGQSVVLPSVG